MASKMKAKLRISHRGSLIVEPWAIEIRLDGKRPHELVATAEDQPSFEIETEGDSLTVYVNGRKATFELLLDGKVVAGCDVAAPALPR